MKLEKLDTDLKNYKSNSIKVCPYKDYNFTFITLKFIVGKYS